MAATATIFENLFWTSSEPKSQMTRNFIVSIGRTLRRKSVVRLTDQLNMTITLSNSVEPFHEDPRCLTFSLSTLHINFFPVDSLSKKKQQKKQTKKTDDKYHLRFGADRVNSNHWVFKLQPSYPVLDHKVPGWIPGILLEAEFSSWMYGASLHRTFIIILPLLQ